MINIGNNTKLLNAYHNIERDYLQYFQRGFEIDYENIYKDMFDENLRLLCSALHYRLIENLRLLNDSINGGKHFWAAFSRALINVINLSFKFVNSLKNSGENIYIDEYYDEIFKKCRTFLSSSGGSAVPSDMEVINIYYDIPIFIAGDFVEISNQSSYKTQLKEIGKGSYAKVFRFFDENYNKYFALKRANKNISEKDLKRFYLEFKVMKELKSPYVLEVYSMDETKNEYIMEYADCTLFDFIQKNNQKLTFEERRKLCIQVIKGFEYLSKKQIFHRDISPKNILIKEYEDVRLIKISDFGIVKINDSVLTSDNTEIRGSFNDYAGLQREGFKNYNFYYEGYAICKLLYFILTGKHTSMNKFDYSNLEEFMNKGINPISSERFENIIELKECFYTIHNK